MNQRPQQPRRAAIPKPAPVEKKTDDRFIPLELFQVTLKGFVVWENKLLIVRPTSKASLWDFPGGRIHKDEPHATLVSSFLRELREELGSQIRIKIKEPWIAYKVSFHQLKRLFPHVRKTRFQGGIINIGFLCEYQGGAIRLSHEHSTYRWVTKDDYQKYAFSPWHKRAIDSFFRKR